MEEEIYKRLKKEVPDEDLGGLTRHLVALVRESRSKMSENYACWDRNMEVYRGERPPDQEDLEAREDNEPEKLIVPMNFAQVQTFVAFMFLLFTNKKRFWELGATGNEDFQLREDGEVLLQRDCRANGWNGKVYQQLVDVCNFNLGVTKDWWAVETERIPIVQPTTGPQIGFSGGLGLAEDVTVFEGNRVSSVSPYLFFPDMRLPLSEWNKGEFAADEQEVTKVHLKKWEADKTIVGSKFVDDFEPDIFEKRGSTRLSKISLEMNKRGDERTMVVLTDITADVIPSKWGLGDQDYPVRWNFWILNDKRIVRAVRYGHAHRSFGYNVAQLMPDMHTKIGQSLADVIFPMTDLITWLFNSRMWSVKRAIDGRVIAHPSFLDSRSFADSASPVIWAKKSAPTVGMEGAVKQLQFTDTTARHMDDANALRGWVQMVTGVSENSMAMATRGRRSATEMRTVNSASAGRMKMGASLVWETAYQPQGRKHLLNYRQGVSLETFKQVLGDGPDVEARFGVFRAEPNRLVQSEDFFMMNSTIESEKGMAAAALNELALAVIQNPEVAQMFDLDPNALIEESFELRGLGRKSRFSFNRPNANTQPTGPLLSGVGGAGQAIAGIPGVPAASPLQG